MNPLTGKREVVDPEGEFVPGEIIVKLYYCKRLDGYVTVPGASVFSCGMVRDSKTSAKILSGQPI